MVDLPPSRYTSVNSTPLGIRYVLLSDVDIRLRTDCENYARGRRARLLLPDGNVAVYYEEWLEWRESLESAGLMSGLGATLLPAELVSIVRSIVANSTSPAAETFDVENWLRHWIERPQPALGGQKPVNIMGTATGLAQVLAVLGAIETGAYL